MKPQDYIQSELEHCSENTLNDQDQKLLQERGIEAFIYSKLTSKKFRKWTVDESSEKQIKRAIKLKVDQGVPLQFRYPFGGYKLWSMPSSPTVDWAEFFAIAYLCRYISPIAAAYKPGVEFLFASDDLIIERMDNIPKVDTDAYFNSFKKLVGEFQKHLPANFTMDIVRIADLYDNKDEMEQELAANIQTVKRDYETNVDAAKKNKMCTTSALNIQWDGIKDLTKLSAAEKRAVIEMGPIYHDAYGALSKRRAFNRGEDKILIFTTIVPNAIAVGTTKSSITKFWTGFGVLEQTLGGFRARVLSPSQLEVAKLDSINLEIAGLQGKNFSKIGILK